MTYSKKLWVGRDESGELRAYTSKPTWIPEDDGNGYFRSKHPNWQINRDEFPRITKGQVKVVKMAYKFVEDFTMQDVI